MLHHAIGFKVHAVDVTELLVEALMDVKNKLYWRCSVTVSKLLVYFKSCFMLYTVRYNNSSVIKSYFFK